MKLKSLVVITLFVLGCGAAFGQGSATLGFTSPADLFLDCDYEQIEWGGSNNLYAQGTDNLTACSGSANPDATMVCVKASNGVGGSLQITAPVYACADNIFDASSGTYTGDQWLLATEIKPSRLLHHYGWVGYVGFSGVEFLANYGYLSASYPGANKSGRPVSTLSTAAAGLRSQTKTRVIP